VSDPETTKRVLAALAQRPVPSADTTLFGDDPDYRAVVDTAISAVERLDEAATFVEAGGLDHLDAAIETAEDRGDHAAARRGRRTREAFAAFRAATRGEEKPAGSREVASGDESVPE